MMKGCDYMKFWQALKAMEEGKKIAKDNGEAYYFIENDKLYICTGELMGEAFVSVTDMLDYEWELYDDRKEVYTDFYKDMYVTVANLMHNYQCSDLESEDVDSGFIDDYLDLAFEHLGKLHDAMKELNKKYKLY